MSVEVDAQQQNNLHEHADSSLHVSPSASGSGSDSSSELGDDFELIKDNRKSVVEYENKQTREHQSKTLESSDSATSLEISSNSDTLPISAHTSSRNHELKEDNFPVTKGGLQKSKVGHLCHTYMRVKGIL